jgi:hypothetical protein
MLTLRCAHCGSPFTAAVPSSAGTQYVVCPHCGAATPVLAPRDPPPLYSWEVYPHLYPALPLPRPLSRGPRLVTLGSLITAVLVLWAIAGLLGIVGGTALSGGSFVAGGTVVGAQGPVPFAHLAISGENGFRADVIAGAAGQFVVPDVPNGGLTLNATAPGYGPTVLSVFVSPVYTSAGGNPRDLVVQLYAGSPSSIPNVVTDSPFPDLETFVTSLWSMTALWGLAGVVVVFGTWTLVRTGKPTRGVIAGAAAVTAPAVPILLSVTPIYSWMGYALFGLALLGITALMLLLIPMALLGRPPDYGSLR